MNYDRKVSTLLAAILILSLCLPTFFYLGAAQPDEFFEVRFEIDDPEEVDEIFGLVEEIVEVNEEYVIARCTQEQINQLMEADIEASWELPEAAKLASTSSSSASSSITPISLSSIRPIAAWSVYFADTYAMSHSQSDSSTDQEVWVSIVYDDQTIKHIQITDTPTGADDPSIAIAPNGNIIVAWEYDDPTLGNQIHYAVLGPNGNIIKPDTALTSSATYSNYEVSVAITPDNVVFMVYEAGISGPDYIGYVTMDVNGNNVSPEMRIESSQTPKEDMSEPTVAASTKNPADTKVVVAWEEEDQNSDDQVWFTILNNAGKVIVPNTRVTTSTVNSAEINAAIIPNGWFALVWEEDVVGDDPFGYAIIRDSGSIAVPATNVFSGDDIDDPAVAATPDGDLVVVWVEEVPALPEDIYFTILNGMTGSVVKAIAPVTTRSLDDNHADVAVDQSGHIVVAWEQQVSAVAGTDRDAFAILRSNGIILVTDVAKTDGTYDVELDGGEGRRQVATRPSILAPVGGVASPINKLEVIAPYVALAGLIIAVSAVYVIKRRKD